MKKLIIVLVATALVMVWYFDLSSYLSFSAIRESLDQLTELRNQSPLQTALVLFLIYVLVTALSIPGAVPLTLVAGAIFGLGWGTLIVSFASTIGASLAFVGARYLFRDWVEGRFKSRCEQINKAVQREGALYLFSLRLVPIFPFFMINLLMGLTKLPLPKFYWVSQVGMLPGTLVYVNAGRSLSEIESPAGILSTELLIAFVLIAVLPWLSKWAVNLVHARKVYAGFVRPKKFDRNLIVIGAGAGGLVSAYIAAAVKARVTLVESNLMGGDCLNYGCVPSKALIRAGRAAQEIREAQRLGISAAPEVDFPQVMKRVRQVIGQVAPHDSVERYTALGVDVVQGYAKLIDPWSVEISDGEGAQCLTAQNIILATGASPRVIEIPGLDAKRALTTDSLWDCLSACEAAPERLVILGGGPIGVELAQALVRLAVPVTLVVRGERILPKETVEAAECVQTRLIADGVELLLKAEIVSVADEGLNQAEVSIRVEGETLTRPFSKILFAIGRVPRTQGFGLEALGLEGSELELNERLQTAFPHIYAVGDLAGPYQFTHAAAHQAWYASVNALFGKFKSFAVDYRFIPRVTYTSPEVAAIGLSPSETADQDLERTRFELGELDRSITEGLNEGYVEVFTKRGSDKILGVEIVADNASDLLTPYAIAMRHGLGLNKLLSVTHAYPSFGEASKYVAGEWKRNHKPERLLSWLQKWFAWKLK